VIVYISSVTDADFNQRRIFGGEESVTHYEDKFNIDIGDESFKEMGGNGGIK
jgi:hypothetical protein